MSGHRELKHKAAGHDGTLIDDDGLLIFKPLNEQELRFYQDIQAKSNDDEHSDDVPLASWMPVFLGVLDEGGNAPNDIKGINLMTDGSDTVNIGTTKETSNDDSKKFLVLQNLTACFNKPNIIDIKLGKILYDDKVTDEKRQRLRQVSEMTTSGTLGFRICGMRVQSNDNIKKKMDQDHFELQSEGEYIFVNKMFGRTRTLNDIEDAFEIYFANENLSTQRRNHLKTIFLQRLQLFFNTILNSEVRMISSSLLFVYEGDSNRWDTNNDQDSLINNDFIDYDESDDEEENYHPDLKAPLSSMSLIDFAHSKLTTGDGYDQNVIEGIESLLDIFIRLNDKMK